MALNDLAALLGAVLLAAAGGEAFLRFILGAAAQLRVPNAIAAASLSAFATSSPELTVSTVAALAGHPEIGLGDALGSNVVNIALVLGLALLFGPLQTSREAFGRDYALALLVPALTLVLVADGHLARHEGALLLLMFTIWLGLMLRAALRHRKHAPAAAAVPGGRWLWTTLALGALGLGALIAAGRLFVVGATGIAASFDIDTFVIGSLIVAIGTSLPELVTVVLSRLRGHDDIGIGTLIGSNLFNGLAIVGIASAIHPIGPLPAEVALTLGGGVAALLLLLPGRGGLLPRSRGLLLLALYGGFVAATLG